LTHGTTIGDNLRPKLIASLVAACFAAPHVAEANPVGASVAVGQATFATQGSTLNVTNTPGAVINWQGFSIGSGETTRFIQQSAASSVLNRVLGADPSVILGNLQSNGKVFLINPAGIMVGQGARIDVAGFVASTLNISNQDFANGRLSFQSNPMAGSVSNAGLITTPEGGNVFLVAPNVSNTGVITAQQGQVILAAGNSVQLVDTGAPGVRVEVTTSENNKAENLGTIIANSGKVGIVGALVRNSGRINADQVTRGADGKVYLRAKKDVTLDASSVITANGERGGDISIQAETGTALVSGRVEATGSAGKGGSLKALGQFVGLTAASLDASGSAGGGSVLVGGDFQGRNPEVQNAWRTFVGSDVSVKADAASQGDGGKVIVWADDTTRYNGSISVKGGADGGNGGFVEVSGKHQLIFRGTVDTSAANGRAGSLLLDPQDIVIANGSGGANDAALSDNSVDSGDANSTTDVTISEQALEGLTGSVTLLASRDVILQHMVDGNLTLSGVTNGSNLTITAGRNISGVNVNDRFVTNGGGIAFTTTNGYIDIGGVLTNGGAVSMTAGGSGGNVVVREIKTTPGGGNGGNINLVAGGIASLGGGNIDARGSGSNGNVTINDLNLTAVGGISDGSSGALTLNATRIRAFNSGSGNIILTNTGTGDIEISDLELSGSGIQNSAASGSVTISASQAKLKVSKAITANAGDITLVSDRMDIADVINSGSSSTGTVTLRPWNNGTAIDLGSSVDSTNSTLELSQTELAKVTAGVLRIGDTPYTGGINITQNLNISTASSFSLLNNADIGVTGSQTITTSKLKVASNGTVALAGNNSVGTLSGTYGSSSNTFTYKNAGALTVGTVDSTSGIAGDGNLTLDTGTGAMTVSSSLNAGAGPIALTTAGSSNNINFGSGVTVTGGSLTLAGTGSAALNSGTVTLNAPAALQSTSTAQRIRSTI
jgi:filamentous hemagglutinin family protein